VCSLQVVKLHVTPNDEVCAACKQSGCVTSSRGLFFWLRCNSNEELKLWRAHCATLKLLKCMSKL